MGNNHDHLHAKFYEDKTENRWVIVVAKYENSIKFQIEKTAFKVVFFSYVLPVSKGLKIVVISPKNTI